MVNPHCRIARATPKKSGLVVHLGAHVNNGLVEKLEHYGELAKKGDLRSGVMVFIGRDGWLETARSFGGPDGFNDFIAAIETMKRP